MVLKILSKGLGNRILLTEEKKEKSNQNFKMLAEGCTMSDNVSVCGI